MKAAEARKITGKSSINWAYRLIANRAQQGYSRVEIRMCTRPLLEDGKSYMHTEEYIINALLVDGYKVERNNDNMELFLDVSW